MCHFSKADTGFVQHSTCPRRLWPPSNSHRSCPHLEKGGTTKQSNVKKKNPNIYFNSYLHTQSEVRTSLAIYSGASKPQTPPADPSDNVADSSADNGIRPTQCPFP